MQLPAMQLDRLPMVFLMSHMALHMFVRGDATTSLHLLLQEFYDWRLEDSPEFATYSGTYRFNDRLQAFSLARMDERKEIADMFKEDLETIDASELCKTDRINYRILKDVLETYLEGYRWRRYGSINPLNFLEGIHVDPVHHVEATPFFTRGDYENFLVRLENTPLQLAEYQDLYRTAIGINHTMHNVSVIRVPAQIERLLVRPEESPFYEPFTGLLDEFPFSDTAKKDLRDRAYSLIQGLLGAFQDMKTFLETDYFPRTRQGWGVGSLDDGQNYYKACLQWHLSTAMSPETVYQIGLQEVERIGGLMRKIVKKQNFKGSITEYFAFLRNNTSLHTDSAEELLEGYNRLINERINPKLHEVFNHLPDLPVKVEPMPYDGPAGEYQSGSEDGSRPGIFKVNVNRPHEIGKYIMVPITLHESVPGHHLQISYALKANLPDFRRNTEYFRYYEVPFHFPFYTAYREGWALYAESLGEELNLYQNDYELMGRYSSEIFRACRLVVDTGLHYYGWNREEAIQYMLNYTSFSRAEMTTEIDRYITWPGQACAYKIGEIKIKELRKRAQDALGELFDIRDFHSVVLENGPMPLTILEEIVDDWILHYRPSTVEETCTDAAHTQHVSVLMSLCLITLSLS
ncbi:uncharacterized protein LOC124125991 isoform X1 [Haliotis rufescens]|uniref:uncharacterized protein LOC124125991 isoform X1 n=2 Tax=Haliotis rufescens TaxID=6454 RepID=UPI00201EA75C|nr:uncharacterized protein LOC124125991 isoform X1 [Haliotis rufescens]